MNEVSTPGLKEWLDHVDNQLIPQAVEHLKLGLYSELSPLYTEAKVIEEPSTLFYFMLNKCLHNNLPKCLKIFLHVLRSIGGTLKGPQLVADAFGVSSRFRIEDPGVLDLSKMSVNFKFFQCLLKIAIQARKVALGEQIMKRFCKERFLNRNYRELKGVPELFISLHQAQFIAADFTHHLVEALSKYKSWICVQHVNEYHKCVGLRSVVFSDAHPGVFSSSLDSRNSKGSLGELSAADIRRHGSPRDLDQITVFNEATANGSVNGSYRRTSKPNEPRNYEVIEASDTDHLLHKGYGIQSSYCSTNTTDGKLHLSHSTKRRFIFIVATGVLLTLFAVAVLIVLGSMVWVHLSRPPVPYKVPIRQGNTVILGEFNTFYYDSIDVNINQDHYPNITDETFYVDFYGIPQSCPNLPHRNLYDKNFNVVFSDKNITEFIPSYALTGSSFGFTLNGKAASGRGDDNLVKVCIYIGATYGSGRPLECMKASLDSSTGNWQVEEPGYYYFTIEPLNGPVTFSFDISGSVRRLHVSYNELMSNCSLNNNVSACSLPLPFTSKDYCVIAEFYHLPYNYLRTQMDVSVGGKRVGVVVAATFLPLIGCILLLLFLVFFSRFLCIKCLWKFRNSNPCNSLTYSI